MDAAYNYITANNPNAAIETIERIEKALYAPIKYPEMGKIGRIPGTRELVITRTPFTIPYRILADQIEILAVVHGAKRWPEYL